MCGVYNDVKSMAQILTYKTCVGPSHGVLNTMHPQVVLLLIATGNACFSNECTTAVKFINHVERVFKDSIPVPFGFGKRLEIDGLKEPTTVNCTENGPEWVRCVCKANFIKIVVAESVST